MIINNSTITTIIGSSVCGKTSGIVIPQILRAMEKEQSFLVCDPKNEIFNYIGDELTNKSYKIININLREPSKSMSWNPLILPYEIFVEGKKQEAYSYLADIAKNIYVSLGSKQKDFWDTSAYGFFIALVCSIYNKAKKEEINIKSILNMTIVGEERFPPSTYMKEYFNLEPENSYSFLCANNVINAPKDTQGGILSTFKNSLQKLLANDKYENILCFNDIELYDCIQKKVAIVLNYEDENPHNSAIITVFIDMLYKYLVSQRTKNPQADIFNMFLDDFLSLPNLYSFDDMIMTARSRNISMSIVINSRSLFEKRYGKESLTALLDNSNNIIYFKGNDVDIHEYFMKLCNQKEFYIDKTLMDYVLVIPQDSLPELLTLTFCSKTDFKYLYVNKHQDEEIKIFSIKEYVKEEKRKKIYENIEKDSFIQEEFFPLNSFSEGRKEINNFEDKEIKNLINTIDKRIQEIKMKEDNDRA